MKRSIYATLLLVLMAKAVSAQWVNPGGIREIPVTNLPDIAIASYDGYGPVIFYSPSITRNVGPYVTAFIQAHEYGHHHLGHIINMNNPNPYIQHWLRKNMENEADQYAVAYYVRNGYINVLRNTYLFFFNSPQPADATHLSHRARAINIDRQYRQLTGLRLF